MERKGEDQGIKEARKVGEWRKLGKIREVWCARPRPPTSHIAPRKTLESGRGCKIQTTTLPLHMAAFNYGKNGDAAQKANQLEKKAI